MSSERDSKWPRKTMNLGSWANLSPEDALETAIGLIAEGRIFAARRLLLPSHRFPTRLAVRSSVILQRLWGLDFRVRMTALEELLRSRDATSASGAGVLERLRWILARRAEDLDAYLDTIGPAKPLEVEPRVIALPDYGVEETALQEALTSLQGADEPRAYRLFLNARKLNAHRLDAINAARTGDPGAVRILAPVDLAEQRRLIEATTWHTPVREIPELTDRITSALERVVANIELDGLDALPDLPSVSGAAEREGLPAFTTRDEDRRPQLDPSRPRAQTKVDSGTRTVLVRRMPHMDVSPTPPITPGTGFRVDIYADLQGRRPDEESDDILANLPEHVLRFAVRVDLLVSPHFIVVGESTATLEVDRREDRSSTASFSLRVREEEALRADAKELLSGSHGSISALFSLGARPCGRVSRTIPLNLRGAIPDAPTARESPTAASLVVDAPTTPPDLLIRVVAHPINDGRQFLCKVWTDRVPLSEEEADWTPWNLPKVTHKLVKEYMVRFVAEDTTPIERSAWLEGAGISLFRVSPRSFQSVFWKMIDSGNPPRTIAVISDEPYIPWELMVPNRRKDRRLDRRRGALGVEFAIGRWINANGLSAPQIVPLVDSLVVAPEYQDKRHKLEHGKAEAEFVSTQFPPKRLIEPANLENVNRTLAEAAKTRVSLLHFACHGAESESEVEQVIYLADDEPLASTMVNGLDGFQAFLPESKPLVFMNACEVGRPSPALVGIGGFARAFIDLGASAVVAPLWSVKDSLAHEVALEFYRKALEEPARSFAEILSEIRARGYDKLTAEDTYAAYCFYGDPLARRASA